MRRIKFVLWERQRAYDEAKEQVSQRAVSRGYEKVTVNEKKAEEVTAEAV